MKQLAVFFLLLGLTATAHATPDATQLQGTWYIQSMVVFDTPTAPDAAHAGDMFTFNADMTFTCVLEGTSYTGTSYAVDASGTWITMYVTEHQAYRAKILSLTADALQIQMIGTDGNVYVLNYDRTL